MSAEFGVRYPSTLRRCPRRRLGSRRYRRDVLVDEEEASSGRRHTARRCAPPLPSTGPPHPGYRRAPSPLVTRPTQAASDRTARRDPGRSMRQGQESTESLVRRHGQRRHAPGHLARNAQRLATGREDPHVRARRVVRSPRSRSLIPHARQTRALGELFLQGAGTAAMAQQQLTERCRLSRRRRCAHSLQRLSRSYDPESHGLRHGGRVGGPSHGGPSPLRTGRATSTAPGSSKPESRCRLVSC